MASIDKQVVLARMNGVEAGRVFNIISHINSRKAGGASAGGYKELAKKYGELGFIERGFANEVLVKMSGYRNRLVHFYADITPEETYDLILNHLDDFAIFLRSVKKVLEEPEMLGVSLEG